MFLVYTYTNKGEAMSQTKMQKLVLRNKKGHEGKTSVGANMEVLLDGAPLKGVHFIKIEVKASKVAKVMIELFAEVEVEGNFKLVSSPAEDTNKIASSGKPVARYEIGNYGPASIDRKKE